MAGYKIAQTLRVERNGSGHALLYIDGELFPYATVDGFSVHPRRGEMPGVTVTIAANRVEVCDDLDGKSAQEPAGSAGTSATT